MERYKGYSYFPIFTIIFHLIQVFYPFLNTNQHRKGQSFLQSSFSQPQSPIKMFSTPLLLLSLLPLAFTSPVINLPTRASLPIRDVTTTSACPTAGLPTDVAPYFYLKTNTTLDCTSTKNNLYLSDYHVEAGSSVAVLSPGDPQSSGADLAYLNGTVLQYVYIPLLNPL